MLLVIILISIGEIFGAPILPLLEWGAFAMFAAAFYRSRNTNVIIVGMNLATYLIGNWIVERMTVQSISPQFRPLAELLNSREVMIAMVFASIVIAMMIGIFSSPRSSPRIENGGAAAS